MNDHGVYITVPESPDHDTIIDLRAIFKSHPGQERVYLLVQSGDKMRKVATEYSVTKDRSLLETVGQIVGPGNVR